MDIDALNRNVTKLMKFMERVEKQEIISDRGATDPNDAKVAELEERLRALGERLDSADLSNLSDRVGALEQHRDQTDSALKEVSELLPQMGELVTWFQKNREMLEGAIAMADAFDGPNAAEQVPDGLQATTGDGSAATGTEAPAAADASQAAPENQAGT